jgi:hypothetical protein
MSSIYQATVLEQAYSHFLAQQVFGIPPGNGPIQITGREAVPFLTQSNVDRGVLRSLWSAADPQNVGTLTQITQFQVLLRLVSMAQAGMLGPQMTADTVRMMIPQYSSQQLALPTFSSVVIPQQDQLMSSFANFITSNNVQNNAPQTMSSNQGGFWSLSQYSSPPLVGNYSATLPAPPTPLSAGFGQGPVSHGSFDGGVQQSTNFSNISDTTSLSQQSHVSTNSVSNAFSDLGPSTDVPLPSLINESNIYGNTSMNPSTGTLGVNAGTSATGGNPTLQQGAHDFGGFENSSPTAGNAISTMPVSNAFNVLGEIQDAPLPSLDQSVQMNPPQQQEADGFGGSENAAQAASNYASTMPVSDAFDAQGGSHDASLPTLDQTSQMNPPQQQDDDFGDFETASPTAASYVPATEESDPFGSLPSSQDAQLPSLDQAMQMNPPQQEDDDFGGFETATNIADGNAPVAEESDPFGPLAGNQDAQLPSLDQAMQINSPQQEDDDFGGFENAAPTAASNVPSAEESDPFGPLAGSHDVPLPSLDQAMQMNLPEQQDDDDFGGFEDAAPTAASNVPSAEESDPFGPLAGSQDVPLPSLDQAMQVHSPQQEDDDFGGFEDAAPTAASNVPSAEESDPFGPLAGSQDAPLPSLDASSQMTFPQQQQQQDNDEFGGFETVAPTANNAVPITEESDPFGPLPGKQDAPLPPLDHISQMNAPRQLEDDDFGGFENAAPTDSAGSVPASEADPFGPLASSEDAQLPSLDQSMPMNNQEGLEDDFGGFGSAAPTDMNKSDDFGSFSTAAPMQVQEGGFDGPTAPDIASATDPNLDPFGSMGLQDAPLPSLDQFSPNVVGDVEESTPVGDNDEDDFGGFAVALVADSQQQDVTREALASATQQEEDDDFGDFGEAKSTADLGGFEEAPVSNTQVLDIWAVETQQEEDDDFGDFDGAPATEDFINKAPEIAGESQTQARDDQFDTAFTSEAPVQPTSGVGAEGDSFGDFSAPTNPPQSQDSKDDEWGAFDSGVSTEASATVIERSIEDADAFGDFSAPSNPPEVQDTEDDEWGAFDSSVAAEPPEQVNSGSGEGEDSFGDFRATSKPAEVQDTNDDEWGAFDSGTGSTDNVNSPQTEESVDDEWGAFDNAGPANSTDDKFDDFSNFQSSEEENFGSNQRAPSISSDDEFGDFGDFDGAGSGKSRIENAMQEKVRELSLQLPESLLRKSGLSGEHVDLGECFEVNIGLELDLDASRRQRVERCMQVLEILTKSDSKLASYWEQLFTVVKDELVNGRRILSEAKMLSPDDLKSVKKPLQTMISGFAEYLRVIRSIVASIGDMLMLDDSALLTIDTWASTWCSLAILEKPVAIEQLWKELEKEAVALSQLFAKANDTTSLKMIRRRVFDRSPSRKLCQLTLVPLSKQDKGTTTGVVSWQGKDFMACSANILANRCPFYVLVE